MCCVEESGEERSGGRGEYGDRDDADDATKKKLGEDGSPPKGVGAVAPSWKGRDITPSIKGKCCRIDQNLSSTDRPFPCTREGDAPSSWEEGCTPLHWEEGRAPSAEEEGRAPLPGLGGVVGVVPVVVLAPAAAPLLPALLHTAHNYFLRLLPSSNDLRNSIESHCLNK